MNNLTILNTDIRADEHGRFCLNDLHRAAMAAAGRTGDPSQDAQRPGKFLRNASVQAFIAALDAEQDDAQICASSVVTVRGKGKQQGTYASELIVMRYAGWISPEFEIKAYRALKSLHDAERTGIPADLYTRALAAEKAEAVSAKRASDAAKLLRRRRDDKPVLLQQVALMRDMVQLCLQMTGGSAA